VLKLKCSCSVQVVLWRGVYEGCLVLDIGALQCIMCLFVNGYVGGYLSALGGKGGGGVFPAGLGAGPPARPALLC